MKDVRAVLSTVCNIFRNTTSYCHTSKHGPANSGKVADAYRFGLDLFCRPDAIANRVTLGKRCVQAWKDPKQAPKYGNFPWSGDEAKIAQYEQQYRKAMQVRPPRVYVRNTGKAYGVTTRMSRAKRQLEGSFDPREMFQVKISRGYVVSRCGISVSAVSYAVLI
jgi:hypothetical protein